MDKKISAIVRSSFCSLKDMYKARCCHTIETCEMMVHAFITTWLDYCTALWCDLPNKQIKKLQEVQNFAKWLVTDTRKYDHITPVHWLPVEKQIVFKILHLIFRECLHGLSPSYLSDSVVKKNISGASFWYCAWCTNIVHEVLINYVHDVLVMCMMYW